MKRSILFAAALLILGFVAYWLLHQTPSLESTSENPAASNVLRSNGGLRAANNQETPLEHRSEPLSVEEQLARRQEAIERGRDEWRTPIEFYGKVVDQNEQLVEEAQVDFSCNDLSVEGTSFYQTRSDSAGLFSITGIRGKLLTVKVAKTRYYSSKRDNDSFYYAGQNSNFVPSQTRPIVFHLRKRGSAEPLINTDFPGFAKIVQLPRDGTPVEIDLIKGTTASAGTGHLRLKFWGDAIERGTKKFGWKCQLSAPVGGLVETDEEFNFEAPESGYKTQIEIEMAASDENWQNTIRRKYFIRLADGKFGRIEFELLARNGVYMIQSLINPSGSRNLEYDEAIQPKQTGFE